MAAPSIVQTFLGHIFAGAMEPALAMVAANARFISTNPKPNPGNPLHGTFTGVDGAKAFFSGFVDLLEPGDFQVIASFGDNEHTASYGTLRHKVRQTGKDFVSDWALICQVQNDKIVLYHFYEDTEALLNAMR